MYMIDTEHLPLPIIVPPYAGIYTYTYMIGTGYLLLLSETLCMK